ncbi:heparinase II/III-family protein [Reichenbachiella agarivorans]|uniref:Heparinase II/III-family protein n=1 Tax=Reichenbachiella agarivorans TaxID=2979464 RepID=A0ABY6CRF7_9BACT|nr:heparinase II/III-family protein [Reichenbachiella agarivorans]UXP32620.1 heparinase II/III-family protein [Reichenbachiella agarivorans]
MYKFKILSLFVILLGSVCSTSIAQDRNYLLYTDDNITRLKSQIKSDPAIKELWNDQLKQAKTLVKSNKGGAADCLLLGLAYRMTGEEQYAKSIKRILEDYTSKETWEGNELLSRTPSWQGGLKTSHTSFYIAVGYDCIYTFLTPDERHKIATDFVRVGIDPARQDWLLVDTNFHTFDTMGHNWWSACVYMAGVGALAVRDEIPEATQWAQEIAATATEWVTYSGSILQNKPSTFDREGGFYESVNYANYGISQYLLFRLAFQEVWPDQPQVELPVLDKIADFFIHASYYVQDNKVQSVPFGDSGMEITGLGSVTLLWNLGFQKDRYAWYINQVNNSGNDREYLRLNSPEGLILHPDLPVLPSDYVPDLPTSILFADMGWATMRSSWEDNATLLAVKSGFTWNHTHADAGSFVVFHNGKYIIAESGKSSYGNPLYSEYYCQSEAHNVVLFDGKGQNKRDPYYGVVNPASLHYLVEGQNFKYVMANATGPYAQILARNYRHFVWVGDVILVIDDLLAHEPGQFEWLLHYNGESKRKGMDLIVKDEQSEVLVRPLYPETFPVGGLPHDFPEQMRLTEKLGYKDHQPDEREPYWSITPAEKTDRIKFISAIVLKSDKNKEQLPVIERFEGKDFIGVSITQNGETTQLYFNLLADGRLKHRNSVNQMNGWETDAYLTVMKFQEGADDTKVDNVSELFIGHGSYLRREGQVLIHALSKYTALVEGFGKQPNVVFHGQDKTTFRLHMNQEASSLQINKKVVSGDYDDVQKMLKIVYSSDTNESE